MMAQAMLKCKHCPTTKQCPRTQIEVYTSKQNLIKANLQGHQETLSLHIRETEVDASWVTVDISVSYNVLNLCIDALNQAIRELFDPGMVPLIKEENEKINILSQNEAEKPMLQRNISTPAH